MRRRVRACGAARARFAIGRAPVEKTLDTFEHLFYNRHVRAEPIGFSRSGAKPKDPMSGTLVPVAPLEVLHWRDDELLVELARCAEERRRLDARTAVVSAEIARRSRRELGHSGLAQRSGERSGEQMIQRIAGGTSRDVRVLVEVGALLAAEDVASDDLGVGVAEGFAVAEPWLTAVTEAVREARLGLEAARSIRAGLGVPTGTVTAAELAAAAARLVARAAEVPADRMGEFARWERDAIDEAGVSEREAARFESRYLRLSPGDEGMTRIHGLLDPESAAIVRGAFDRVTAPRRGGPRFIDPAEKARAKALIDDPRSTEQLLLDAFVAMVGVAVHADRGALFGRWEAGVRVHVDGEVLRRRSGAAHIEGETAAVSVETVERMACGQGIVPVAFDDDGACVNVGREQRLFTRRQRIGLASRDGGCRHPGCTAPPSWAEAHHIDEWAAHGGKTDLADGVLLCRFHHLNVHNNGWRVRRRGADYWLEPPPTGPTMSSIPMPSRDPVRRSR